MSKQRNPKNSKSNSAQKGVAQKQKTQKKNSGSPPMPKQKPQRSLAAAYATGTVGKSPKINANAHISRIVHRELIDNVNGATDPFTVHQTYPLNPGLSTSFPWLSTQAVGWEKYRFRRLRILVLTRAASTDKGSIIACVDHDAADAAPSTEQIACAHLGTAEDAVWKDITNTVRCPSDWRYVRTAPLSANLDIKTYDIGNLFMCSASCSANIAFGKLFFEYEVEFSIPQLPATGVITGGSVQGGGTMSAANTYGTAPVPNIANSNFAVSTGSLLTLQKVGTYLLNQTLQGTGITNAGAPNLLSGVASIANTGVINTGATFADVKSEVVVSNAPAVFNLANSVAATTITQSHLDVGTAPSFSL